MLSCVRVSTYGRDVIGFARGIMDVDAHRLALQGRTGLWEMAGLDTAILSPAST
jgi:hypothetical protein